MFQNSLCSGRNDRALGADCPDSEPFRRCCCCWVGVGRRPIRWPPGRSSPADAPVRRCCWQRWPHSRVNYRANWNWAMNTRRWCCTNPSRESTFLCNLQICKFSFIFIQMFHNRMFQKLLEHSEVHILEQDHKNKRSIAKKRRKLELRETPSVARFMQFKGLPWNASSNQNGLKRTQAEDFKSNRTVKKSSKCDDKQASYRIKTKLVCK